MLIAFIILLILSGPLVVAAIWLLMEHYKARNFLKRIVSNNPDV